MEKRQDSPPPQEKGEVEKVETKSKESNPSSQHTSIPIRTSSSNTPSDPKQPRQRRRRHGARNQHRHKLFVRWIAKIFPDELHQAKSQQQQQHQPKSDNDTNNTHHHPSKNDSCPRRRHVLDVAGGKGELSARLTLCHTTNVTMIDPRPADVLSCFQKDVFKTLPKKWQQKVSGGDPKGDTERLRSILNERFQQLVTRFPCDGSVVPKQNQDDDGGGGGSTVDVNEDIMGAIRNATLLIGLHADGATEAIVDLALHFRKPFVVVPCCVFPNFFQHRFVPPLVVSTSEDTDGDDDDDDDIYGIAERIRSGTDEKSTKRIPVRTHEDFCRYLALKDSHFVVETLPFEGRNIAIWWDGKYRDSDEKEKL